MIKILDLKSRANLITNTCQNPIGIEHIYLRGEYQPLPVIRAPLTAPIYRTNNGRLAVAEADYLTRAMLPADFFVKGEELQEVQEILHEMLLDLAKNPKASIYQELEKSGIQTEKLLLTASGVVLDGNRRLASMRTLYQMDSNKYSSFNNVEAIILPSDCNESDLEMVEAAKQMAPDLKLPYSWLDRRIKLRHHRDDLSLPVNIICDSYRLESPEHLNNEITELELAERYLSEYLNRPGEYKLLEDAEDYITGLRTELAVLPDNDIRHVWMLVGFAMIKEANTLEIPPNQYYPFVESKPAYAPVPVLEIYGGENNLWPYKKELGSGGVLKKSNYRDLVEHLKKADDSLKIAQSFRRLFNQLLSEFDDNPNPTGIINRLKQVNHLLLRVEIEKFTVSQKSELFGLLAELSYQFQYLTNTEKKDSEKPVVVTGFSPSLNRMLRAILINLVKVKDKFKKIIGRGDRI